MDACLEPYAKKNFQKHTGCAEPKKSQTSAHWSKAGLKVGALGTTRSFLIGISTVQGPAILQSKGLHPVFAENITTLGTTAINTLFKHAILHVRDQSTNIKPTAFTYGKFSLSGFAKAVMQTSGIVSPSAHVISTYSRYPTEVAKQMSKHWNAGKIAGFIMPNTNRDHCIIRHDFLYLIILLDEQL